MKVKIELFGASRDFSSHNSLDLNLNNNSTIKDIRNELINYLDEKFNGNEGYKKILVQINRSSQRSKLINKTNDFIKSLNLTSTKTIIGNRQIYTSSMGEGKTAVEKQKKGSAVEEIKNLSEQIILEL